MAIPNTQWQSNPLLRQPSGLNPEPAISPMQGPVQPTAPVQTTPTAPVTPVAPEPTIGETLTGIKNEALRIQDVLNRRQAQEKGIGDITFDTGPSYEEVYAPVDEEAIRRNQMKLFQSEINATNKLYDEMLGQERMRGLGRLGTQRAISARGGLLGSDFGEAQRANVEGINVGQENLIQAERQAKIGSIMGTMRKAVADEIAAKRAARKEDAESYIAFLASAKERRQNNANLAASALLSAELDPTTMAPAELDAIAKEAGLKTQDIILAYQTAKAGAESAGLESRKTQAEIDKIEADIAKGKLVTIGEGTMLYNTETGETFKNPKTYAPGTGSAATKDYLTTDNKKALLGAGFSSTEIEAIADDVVAYGLDSVIKQAQSNGATTAQINALRNVYKVEGQTESKIDRKFISDWYGIPDNNEGGNSFLGFEWGQTNAEQLDNLMATINRYKAVGMTDEEIYKALEQ